MPDPPAEVDAGALRELEADVGDNGILCFSVGDAIGHVVGLFDFEDFVMRCYDDDGPILALLDKAQALVLRAIDRLGAIVDHAAFRLWGPEYCGAPLMDPRVYFPRYVIERDQQATNAIHASNNISVIHCHGKLRDILDMIGEIGADALEPIETLPLPTADVTLAEVKQCLGSRMCLMGAVQARTLETGATEEVRQQVREAIDVAAGDGGFLLLPTAAPFMVPLDARCLANCEAMYLAAHEFGSYRE
jgi:uroporphyrinogen-III decarboxylase